MGTVGAAMVIRDGDLMCKRLASTDPDMPPAEKPTDSEIEFAHFPSADSHAGMFSIWVRARFVLEWLLLRGVVRVVPCLPYGCLKWLAARLGALTSWVDYRGRGVALENLRLAFPERSLRELKRLRHRNYQTFARVFAELFWSRNFTKDTMDRFVTTHVESPATRQAMETGCIFATIHAGNFEWLSRTAALMGYPSMIVGADFLNARLTPIFRELRQVDGHILIPQENAVLRLFRHLKRQGRTAMLVDLNVPTNQSATIIQCFGMETCVTLAHAALAQRTGTPIVPAISLLQPDGRYGMHFLEPILVQSGSSWQSVTQLIWDRLELHLRKQPEMWLWMYKHWRYLPASAPANSYPSYSHRSKKYDKLAAEVAAKKD